MTDATTTALALAVKDALRTVLSVFLTLLALIVSDMEELRTIASQKGEGILVIMLAVAMEEAKKYC